jgi:hypothetical protein
MAGTGYENGRHRLTKNILAKAVAAVEGVDRDDVKILGKVSRLVLSLSLFTRLKIGVNCRY